MVDHCAMQKVGSQKIFHCCSLFPAVIHNSMDWGFHLIDKRFNVVQGVRGSGAIAFNSPSDAESFMLLDLLMSV